MLRRRKGPSQFPGGRKDAGTSCLPRVSPSTSPHPLPIPSIPASDPSRCFWVRTILPTASLLPLFTCTPPGTVGVTPALALFVLEGTTGGSRCWTADIPFVFFLCHLDTENGLCSWGLLFVECLHPLPRGYHAAMPHHAGICHPNG